MVGSGKLASQTESSSSIYIVRCCNSLLIVFSDDIALFYIMRNFRLPTVEDAKTIVESYWQQYCQMKDWIGQA